MTTRRRTLREIAPEVDDEDDLIDEPVAPAWFAVARGAALFIGCLILLNLLGEMRFPQLNLQHQPGPNACWLDLRPLPRQAGRGFFALTAILLVLFSFFPRINAGLRRFAGLCTLGLLGAALWNTWHYYQVLHRGQSHADLPLPFSLHVAGIAASILPALWSAGWERFNLPKDLVFSSIGLAACIIGFPLAQFFCLGKADERCAADAVLVLADEASAGKTPEALVNQMRVACSLYKEQKAHKMILIGQSTESEATMRRLVLEQGVPAADFVMQPATSSEGSPTAAAQALGQQKLGRVLISGRFYQLPRIKLCCLRAGVDACGVPLAEEFRFKELRPLLIREAAALWLCYLEPLLM